MADNSGPSSAKRIKLSAGAPIASTALPRYQPPKGATSVSSSTSLSHAPDSEQSLKITIKAPPNKLRQATAGTRRRQVDPYENEQAPAGRTVRSTRNPRAVVEPDSDEEMEDDDEPELEGEVEDDEDEEDEEDEEGEEEEDAEGEEDEDELAASYPPPPPRIQQTSNALGKPKLKISAPREGPLKSVEAKEVDEEDEELSDVDSDDEIQNTNAMELDDDDDEELDEEEEEGDEDAEGEDDSELGSGSATPDLSKLTRRQRGELEDFDGGLMALSNEAKSKKEISAEEHVMRRAEMARRRKNLSEKRNEEEKIDTINKLLKKPAPKRRTRAEILAAQAAGGSTPGADDDSDEVKPDPVYTRWVNNAAGSRIGVPVEWLDTPAGEGLARQGLVQEVA